MMMMNAAVLMQVCRLSSEESDSSAVERSGVTGQASSIVAASPASPGRRSNSRRSSYSGTSTGSDAPSSNGLSDDAPVFDDNADGAGVMLHAVNDRRPSTDPAPPVPPPRRFAVLSSEVWQRHAVCPATDGVRRRVLTAAADTSLSSAARSCPSSPLLDNVGLRRAADGVTQSQFVGGRRMQALPLQNERETAAIGSASRRSKLPLSPLARTQRDIR